MWTKLVRLNWIRTYFFIVHSLQNYQLLRAHRTWPILTTSTISVIFSLWICLTTYLSYPFTLTIQGYKSQGQISSETPRCHGIPQVYNIYHIRPIIITCLTWLQWKGGLCFSKMAWVRVPQSLIKWRVLAKSIKEGMR